MDAGVVKKFRRKIAHIAGVRFGGSRRSPQDVPEKVDEAERGWRATTSTMGRTSGTKVTS